MSRPKNGNGSCHVGVDLTLMIPRGGNGGIKPAILTFLRSLSERFQNGIKFTLLTNSSTYQEVEFLVRAQDRMICVALTHDCPWPAADSAHPNLMVCTNFTPGMLKQLGVDVFYCPFGPTDRSNPDVPTVSLVTDLLHRDYPFSIPEAERIWREGYFKNILADADFIQCISQYTMDRLLKYYSLSESRVFFTHLPIDQRLQAELGSSPGNYFIYPANFWVHKNHEVLLIAYRIYLRSAREPWGLLLTGNPDSRADQVLRLAEDLGIRGNIQFVGHLDEIAFTKVFVEAGALVFPSLYEGFGIPILEAMRLGKPIICSRAGSIPEVAGDVPIYVDGRRPSELATAMGQLAEDSALRDSLALKGAVRLKHFSITSEVDKLYQVFAKAKRANSGAAKYARSLRKWGRLQLERYKPVPARSFVEGIARRIRAI
jgi:glycosyltransferase involved in cell wall biosynthesis